MGKQSRVGTPKWILIATGLFGLLAAALVLIVRYYEIKKAGADAEHAHVTAAQARHDAEKSKTLKDFKSDADAINIRGLELYDEGRFNEAVSYLRAAAEMGHPKAQNHLAVCYKLGRGVPQNDSSALKWLHQAGEQGEVDAQYNLGIAYMEGAGVGKNEVIAAEWFEKAALQGKMSAQFNLGVYYESGRGVRQDMREAIRWYTMAANQGDAQAKARLRKLGAP